jgi:hypothetical protein
MSEYSTKISDLPDNTSSRVLNDLRDDISIISDDEDEDQDPEPEQEEVKVRKDFFLKKKKSKKTKFLSEDNLKIIYDGIIVLILVLLVSNQQLMSKIPYLTNYIQNSGSMTHNIIIAVITAVLYIIVKMVMQYYKKCN